MDIALVVPILKNVQSFRKFHRRKREKFGFNFGNFHRDFDYMYTKNVTPGNKTLGSHLKGCYIIYIYIYTNTALCTLSMIIFFKTNCENEKNVSVLLFTKFLISKTLHG